jgi:GntR family transcriptional regulator of vanillate catabolism
MDEPSRIEQTVLTLREALLRGDFGPGERISEVPLAARLGVSRTPLRLALQRLAHEGLLQTLPGRGFAAGEFTLEDIWDAIEIRGVLEGTAARLAAERLAGATELKKLRTYCNAMEALAPMHIENFVRYLELNEAFHRELWRLAKSPILIRAIESVLTLPFAAPGALVFGDAESQYSDRASHIAMEHHRAILEAIENREGARAESLAREHSRVARRNLGRALEDGSLRSRVPGAALIKFPVAV